MTQVSLGTVLVIDDNPGDVELIRIAFEEAAMPVDFEVATDGSSAIDRLQTLSRGPRDERPDLILLDLNLPQVSGQRILAFIKEQPSLEDIPTVVLTTSNAQHDRVQCLALGALDYFVKPSRFEDFVVMMKRLRPILEKSRATS